jgi:hypothetical protein
MRFQRKSTVKASRYSISHDRAEETVEAKALWFASLSLAERMAMLCMFTDLALSATPTLQECKCAEPVEGRVQVLSKG